LVPGARRAAVRRIANVSIAEYTVCQKYVPK